MTRFVLHLRVDNQEGSLERILGLLRCKGYQLRGLNAHAAREGEQFDVTLKLERSDIKGNLVRHIQKLIDVQRVEMYGEVQAQFG